MAPVLVPETQKLPNLSYAYGGLAVFCELVTIVIVTRWVGGGGGAWWEVYVSM